MVPTARASQLRLRLRVLVSDAEALMLPDPPPPPGSALRIRPSQYPPLASQSHQLPEGQP